MSIILSISSTLPPPPHILVLPDLQLNDRILEGDADEALIRCGLPVILQHRGR